MNLHWPLHFRKPEPLPHVVVRHVIATRSESKAAQRRKDATTAELRRFVTEQKLIAAVARAVSMPLSEKDGQ